MSFNAFFKRTSGKILQKICKISPLIFSHARQSRTWLRIIQPRWGCVLQHEWQPHDGASVLACAHQLKVRSKNPKNFKYWFCQWLTGKTRNDFIKQHQRGRWRYLSLFTHLCWRMLPNVCLISLKNTSKIHRTLFTFRARVRKRAPA